MYLSNLLSASWSVDFKPHERNVAEAEAVVVSVTWWLVVISSLLAMYLFIYAGKRLKNGDYSGSVMSFVAAVIVAVAPFMMK